MITSMPDIHQNLFETASKRSLSYRIKASSEDTSETSEIGEVFSGLKEKVSHYLPFIKSQPCESECSLKFLFLHALELDYILHLLTVECT